MKRNRLKFKLLFTLALFPGLLNSCSNNENGVIIEKPEEVGYSFFEKSNNSNVEIFVLDGDDVINETGLEFTTSEKNTSNSVKSSDCYLIRSGDVELLVDGGFQALTTSGRVSPDYSDYIDLYVQKNVENNLLRKIASLISSDGVLDYLIVTHADFDHIASLIVKDGIFDAFINEKSEAKKINGEEVPGFKFKQIKNIIDFDSGLIKKFSDLSIDNEKRLVRSEYYQVYRSKREKLINKNTNASSYCPAASFFDKTILESKGINFTEDYNVGIPDAVLKRINEASGHTEGINLLYCEESSDGYGSPTVNRDYMNQRLLDSNNGHPVEISLKNENGNEEKRYYYSLRFGVAELRILFNWHYFYIFHSSFNRKEDGDETQIVDPTQNNLFDSQDANNISVCFEIVSNDFKFLSCGDLGGNGENGLLKYYKGTDVLTNISAFKASHHGSTSNKENSQELFETTKPSVIIITGCSMYKDPNWNNSSDDQAFAAMVGAPVIKNVFFNHVYNAFKDVSKPYILCTNIISKIYDGILHFRSTPFYGDIKIKNVGKNIELSYSYAGIIKPYISQAFNIGYEHEFSQTYSFKTRTDGNAFISFQQTDWFEKIGYKYQ